MTDAQIKQILLNMRKLSRGYEFYTSDREIQNRLDEIAPYVVGYKRGIRGFECLDISELGKSILN